MVKRKTFDLEETKKVLNKKAKDYRKEGYNDDASEKDFRRHCLILLDNIDNKLSELAKLKKSIKTNNSLTRKLTNVLKRFETNEI